ncbi:P-loop ATPase, Sll1717 family [Vulcaniibacterium tengchongense]|uniref:AAA ATPase-like protein n=1 Tax=Vulcaniibacterium tengchongense TaxID=1273429 RepID=A0A3N4VQ04_9GAMM|nr:ATP-binding protein [Vulcaniibacterium tengchongense]RPE81969.1 hypothetical protein EDC50_1172 [Vulcaniibacterium tengchongense]
MENLEGLLRVVPTGTSEGERTLLEHVFISFDLFETIAVPVSGSPCLVVGKKGAGKSAVLDFITFTALQAGIRVVRLSPQDVKLSSDLADAAVGDHARAAYEALMIAVAGELGSELKGFLSDEEAILLEKAVESGRAKRDFISRLAKVLPRLASAVAPTASMELSSSAKTATDKLAVGVLERLEREGKVLYVLVDDTDQVADPMKPGHLNRIWGLILALRKLAQSSPSFRVVVTLRDEVWREMRRDGAGQRDQADHFDALICRLAPDDAQMKRIVARRLEYAREYLGFSENIDGLSLFFDGIGANMPGSKSFSSWFDLIVSRSRGRPRDSVQLINGLARTALERISKSETTLRVITQDDLNSEISRFSSKRVEYLRSEAERECPGIDKLIDDFSLIRFDEALGSFAISHDGIISFLKAQLGAGYTIRGRRYGAASNEGALALLEVLFDFDVLNARVSDSRMPAGYRFLKPHENATLASGERWGEMQGIVWELNPAFRDHVIRKQNERNASFGLAVKPRAKKRSKVRRFR